MCVFPNESAHAYDAMLEECYFDGTVSSLTQSVKNLNGQVANHVTLPFAVETGDCYQYPVYWVAYVAPPIQSSTVVEP